MRRVATLALLGSLACAPGEDYEELAITCEGKCDGLSSIKALISDAKDLGLSDLIGRNASFASASFDDLLGNTAYASIQAQPTELYGRAETSVGNPIVKNLDALVSGLATRYGENALTTEVNAVRADYLAQSGKQVYVESAFRLGAGVDPSWSLISDGFGADARVGAILGFEAGVSLEGRVVAVHDNPVSGLVQSPLNMIKAARGFIVPRSLDDVRTMAPGESFALAGEGTLGLNIGAGVPILIANPTSWLTYSLVVNAGLRSVFEGRMDVQLVRLPDDEVVIDVGVEQAQLISASIGLRDGFGIHGLVAANVEVGGISVDLGRLLESALQKRIVSKLHLLEGAASRTQSSMRMSVARLRFELDGPDPTGGRAQALAQALRGDLRLAQALAARHDSGVVAEFDLVRSGASVVSQAGIDILGMSFHRRTAESEGMATIQTPGGVLSLMWETLHRAGGWFWTTHGYTRVGVAGLRFDARRPGSAEGETNMFLQTAEGDDFIERDQLIDQLDSLIVALAGKSALYAIEISGNQLERLVRDTCRPQPDTYDEDCNLRLIQGSQVASLRAQGLADLDRELSRLPADLRDLVHVVGDLRLAANSVEDPPQTAPSPRGSVVVDYRLDDASLRAVMSRDKVAMREALKALMEATQIRRASADPLSQQRTDIYAESRETIDAMAEIFQRHADQYQRLLSVESATIEGLGAIGANAVEVRFTVDAKKRPAYAEAVSLSVAQARAQVANAMFDELRAEADDMPRSGDGAAPYEEQIAAFALLSLASAEHLELRLNFQTDTSSCALCPSRENFEAAGWASLDRFAKGPSAAPLAAGLFDIDALIAAPR